VKKFRSASTPILQAVIPLLFEANLQKLVHKILVVYIPWEMQRERLMKRDHISRVEAERILSAQMPLDEKMARADFVIHNEKGLEKTRKQVENIMHSLKTKLAVRIKNG
jgi:dephospho-CoA kinase